MHFYRKTVFCAIFFFFSFSNLNSKDAPSSFADLAEKLMPSVVNISTTQIIKASNQQLPFKFPPGSPFEEMFKDFQQPKERKASSLGSGFIINKNGSAIREIIIKNYRQKERIDEIINTATWSLTRMVENSSK